MPIERYGVYWVNLDPVQGHEIAKTRPAVVVSDDAMNRLLSTVVVCPLTSRLHPHWPCRVQADVAGQPGEIAVDQIRTIDRSRLGNSLGIIAPEKAEELRHVITLMYGVLAG
ncbi:MAG: type II toxin-antitoxin system PemK/MazF family toxin [Spirochaetales bacterium]